MLLHACVSSLKHRSRLALHVLFGFFVADFMAASVAWLDERLHTQVFMHAACGVRSS